ncbi:histidyl-tRNA synthetase [Mycoplasmoides fastidiosum]|uniref:Histidine--tRNA ligase n=1 Tax=Mycoplasmoides fastidiosum TaxID=92758 RepID=A0ABU0M0I1_9BACT|nr:histidine--tRNA ligase [Mycoplasmoides fastidiosum]MDQ0514350.1 histidyl-tRNA synthetase [Mycoplasmoides fastidiosum]UUD38049.1 histidine--tRNA ligase [Mycoplasmoides fastidiosum]
MNTNYVKPRGTLDLYGEEQSQHQFVIDKLVALANIYGFAKVSTPIYESSNVFNRSLGATSDLVQKEFFELKPRKENRNYVLRPEGTAPIMRMISNEKLLFKLPWPLKFYYHGPMFRYERPQAGRLRQFYQFGAEVVGADFFNFLEVIEFCQQIVDEWNLSGKVKLHINYLGNDETKLKWNEALKAHFSEHLHELSPINQARVNTNPLRILDDKNDQHLECVQNAPTALDFLSESDQAAFDRITRALRKLGIKFEIDHKLVRGFDYYSGFVFEFIYTGRGLEGQDTLIGGGEYKQILKEFGDPNDATCLGFAIGVERMLVVLKANRFKFPAYKPVDIYVACMVDEVDGDFIKLMWKLRQARVRLVVNYSIKKWTKHLKIYDSYNKPIMMIYGEQEQERGIVTIQDLQTRVKTTVKLTEPNEVLAVMSQVDLERWSNNILYKKE